MVMDQVMALLPGLPNPDTCIVALLSAVFGYLRAGKLGEAGRASAQAIETAAGLTPHHRLHAAAWQNMLATLTGRWDEVRPGPPRPSERRTPTSPRPRPA